MPQAALGLGSYHCPTFARCLHRNSELTFASRSDARAHVIDASDPVMSSAKFGRPRIAGHVLHDHPYGRIWSNSSRTVLDVLVGTREPQGLMDMRIAVESLDVLRPRRHSRHRDS